MCADIYYLNWLLWNSILNLNLLKGLCNLVFCFPWPGTVLWPTTWETLIWSISEPWQQSKRKWLCLRKQTSHKIHFSLIPYYWEREHQRNALKSYTSSQVQKHNWWNTRLTLLLEFNTHHHAPSLISKRPLHNYVMEEGRWVGTLKT